MELENKCIICSKPSGGRKACSNSCYSKNYLNNNLEKERARHRNQYWKYKKENYERVREINRKATKKYKAKNRELIRQKDKEYNLRTHQSTIYHRKIRFGGKWDEVMKRDNYRCTVCGITKEEKRLVVHHKDRTGQLAPHLINNSLDNLVVLCQKCHLAEHRDQLYLTRR